jgi:acyl-CoA thioester hydrolase
MLHTSSIAVRFADIDAMGHVNNATYLNYFEQARMQFFHDSIGGKWDWKRDGIVLARNEIDYILPILLQESVLIDTMVETMGTKSLTISYEVYNKVATDRIIYARGKSVIVCFDYHAGKTSKVPDVWRQKFSTKD